MASEFDARVKLDAAVREYLRETGESGSMIELEWVLSWAAVGRGAFPGAVVASSSTTPHSALGLLERGRLSMHRTLLA